MTDPTTIHDVLDFVGPIIVALIVVFTYEKFKSRSEMKRAQAEADKAFTDAEQADSTISQVNISTALLLLERVRKENLDLVTRAEACAIAAGALTDEIRKLQTEVKVLQHKLIDDSDIFQRQTSELSEGAKRLYYQQKSKGESPAYTPPNISGPLTNQHD